MSLQSRHSLETELEFKKNGMIKAGSKDGKTAQRGKFYGTADSWLCERVILALRNELVNAVDNSILQLLLEREKSYYSINMPLVLIKY